MIFIKRNKNRIRLGPPRISVQEDIDTLLNHDWSDPLLDQQVTTVVEKLTRKSNPGPKDQEAKEVEPPPLTRGQRAY